MGTVFPANLDDFDNPIPPVTGEYVWLDGSINDAPQPPANQISPPNANLIHANQHANINDAAEAVEAKIGVDNSAVSTSLDYQAHHHAHTGADGSVQVDYDDILNTPVIPPGVVPSDSVEDETTYGISPDAGIVTTFSRGDHTHGSVGHDSYLNLTDVPASFLPSAHHISHENGGSDEVSVVGLSGLLADAQTPLSHHTTHENGGGDEISVAGLSGLLADSQTPLAHNLLGTIHSDTTAHAPVLGDLIVANSTWQALAGNVAATKKFLSQTGDGINSALPVWSAISAGDITGAPLTKVDDTNITLALGGSPATALLNATSLTLGWTGTLAAARLNSNVVQSVVNDTNVTGSIAVQVLTLGWTGQLSVSRGGTGAGTALAAFNALSPLTTLGDTLYHDGTDNKRLAGNITSTKKFLRQTGTSVISAAPAWDTVVAGDIAGSDLTKVDDTNITLTLGGSPTTALLSATSLTLGWSGTLSIARGGTGQSTATAAFDALSPTTTRGDLITRNASNNVRLAVGANNSFLRTDGTDASWSTGLLSIAAAKTLTVTDSTTITNAAIILANTKTLTLTGSLNVGADTAITGGGTLTMGGFTLTVPATGTAALGTGANTRVAFWSGTNTLSSDANFTWSSSTLKATNISLPVGTDVSTPSNKLAWFSGTTNLVELYGANDTTANQTRLDIAVSPSFATSPTNDSAGFVALKVSGWNFTSATTVAQGVLELKAAYATTSFDTKLYATVGSFGGLRLGDSTAPTAYLDVVGKFLVNSSGNVTKINNIAYSFPASQAAGANYGLVNNGSGALTWQNTAGTYAPLSSTYLVISNDATLTNERALAVNTTNLSLTDGGAGASATLNTTQNIDVTASPTFVALTLSGNLTDSGAALRTWSMARNTTSNTAGQGLTIDAGGATTGSTDKAGGNIIIQAGISTGSARSSILLNSAPTNVTSGGVKTVAAAPTNGGTGYTAGDTLTITTGSGTATVTVSTVSGGIITALTTAAVVAGTGYAVGIGQATSGGTGTGATVSVTVLTNTADNAVVRLMTLTTNTTTGLPAIGIGNNAPASPIDISYTNAVANSNATALNVISTLTQTVSANFNNYAFNMMLTDQQATGVTNTNSQAAMVGDFRIGASHLGTFSNVRVIFSSGLLNASAAGAVTNWSNYYSNMSGTASNTVAITNWRGFWQQTGALNGGTITNAYGIYIDAITFGGTLNYSIFTNGGLVHFGDTVDLASGKDLTLLAGNIVTDTTTGTKVGTATTQKIGFFNQTPIVQPLATIDLGTVLSNLGLRAAGTAYPISTTGAITLGRIFLSNGTAIATTDVAVGAGWGANATCSAVTGNDSRGTITITTSLLDTPLATPTLTLTFKNGTWTTVPFAVCNINDSSTGTLAASSCHCTATTLVLSYDGTPTALSAKTYIFNFHIVG